MKRRRFLLSSFTASATIGLSISRLDNSAYASIENNFNIDNDVTITTPTGDIDDLYIIFDNFSLSIENIKFINEKIDVKVYATIENERTFISENHIDISETDGSGSVSLEEWKINLIGEDKINSCVFSSEFAGEFNKTDVVIDIELSHSEIEDINSHEKFIVEVKNTDDEGKENLSKWNNKSTVKVTNNNLKTLNNYQLLLNIDYQEEMQPDFSDIRFAQEINGEEIIAPYWLRDVKIEDRAKVWIKVPEIPADTESEFTLYYGNDTVNNRSDGVETFNFFDNFESDSINSHWEIIDTNGSVSVESGQLKSSTTGGSDGIVEAGLVLKDRNFNVGNAVHSIARTDSQGRHTAMISVSEGEIPSVHNASNIRKSLMWYVRGEVNDTIIDSQNTSRGGVGTIDSLDAPRAWNEYQINYYSDTYVEFKHNNNLIDTLLNTSYIPPENSNLRIAIGGDGYKPNNGYYDTVFVRSIVEDQPTTDIIY